MNTQEDRAEMVRTTVMITAETDRELRRLAAVAHRPFSWEVRRALDDHIARQAPDEAAA